MMRIKLVNDEMYGNVAEAKEKIEKAYALKDSCPEAAEWFRDMADAHIRFNDEGHAVVERMIEEYKSTEAYRSNPEYARGMTDAWKSIHAEMRAQSARVAAMINQYK